MSMNSSNRPRDSPPERVEREFNSAPGSSMIDVVAGEKTKDMKPAADSYQKLAPQASQPADRLEKIEDEEDDFTIPERFTKNGRKKAVSFPLKLMQVLSKKEHADIITWLPDGKAFKIIRPRAFKKDILPKYFKEAKYSSFKRKISRWGFQPVKCEEESDTDWFGSEIFRHDYFQRGDLKLAEKMSCRKAVPVHPNLHRPAQTGQSIPSQRLTKKAPLPQSFSQSLPQTFRQSLAHPEATGSVRSQVAARPTLPLPDLQNAPIANQADSLEAAIDAEVRRRTQAAAQADSLEAAIDAEVRRRLREREVEMALSNNMGLGNNIGLSSNMGLNSPMSLTSNMRINALIQEKLAGAHRAPPLSLPTGTSNDLLNMGNSDLLNMGMLPSGMNRNMIALRALGQMPTQASAPSASALLEEQRLKLRMLQEAQYLSMMNSGKKDHARSA